MSLDDAVLAFKREDLPIDWLDDIVVAHLGEGCFKNAINKVHSFFKIRNKIENDDVYKQPIPYILIKDFNGMFACYPRNGNENRLHGLWSVGVGGHVDEIDRVENNYETILAGAYRELQEETFGYIPAEMPLQFLGIINEEKTKVGHTHIGVVFLVQLKQGQNIMPKQELTGLQWCYAKELGSLELWSQLALKLVQ